MADSDSHESGDDRLSDRLSVVSDDSDSGDRSTTPAQSFLAQLRAPRRSELTRKRKVRHNTARSTVRKRKPSCSTDPRSVTPLQRVREFADEALTVSASKLFCTACREELSLKLSTVKTHVKTSNIFVGRKFLLLG